MELNKIMIVGRLGHDPSVRYANNGSAVADFSLAVTRRYRDGQGQNVEKTNWFKVNCFGKPAEFAQDYLKKGAAVLVEGRLDEHEWTPSRGENAGQKRKEVIVVAERLQFAEAKGSAERGTRNAENDATAPLEVDGR